MPLRAGAPRALLCIAFAGLSALAAAEISVLLPEDAGVPAATAYVAEFGDAFDTIEGELVFVGRACGSVDRSLAEGKIALADAGSCSPETKARAVQKAQAAALVLVTKIGDWDGSSWSSIRIPSVFFEEETDGKRYKRLVGETDEPVVVRIVSRDNPWITKFGGASALYISYSVILGLWAMFNSAAALVKLRRFVIQSGGLQLSSIAQLSLILHFAANLLRIMFGIDPHGWRLLLPYWAVSVTISIHLPLSVLATLLLVLFWAQATSDSKSNKSSELTKYRVHFIVIGVTLILLEVIAAAMRANYMAEAMALIIFTSISYALINLIVGATLVYYGLKLNRKLSDLALTLSDGADAQSKANKRQLSKTRYTHALNKRILWSSFFILWQVMGLFLIASPLLFASPESFLFVFFFAMVAALATSTAEISAITVPRKRSASTSLDSSAVTGSTMTGRRTSAVPLVSNEV